jgi:hypothetical protein
MRQAKRNRFKEMGFLEGFLMEFLVEKLAPLYIAKEDLREIFPKDQNRRAKNSTLGRRHAILHYLKCNYSVACIAHFLNVSQSEVFASSEEIPERLRSNRFYRDEYERVHKYLSKSNYGVHKKILAEGA